MIAEVISSIMMTSWNAVLILPPSLAAMTSPCAEATLQAVDEIARDEHDDDPRRHAPERP
jgi:hypothetical protein